MVSDNGLFNVYHNVIPSRLCVFMKIWLKMTECKMLNVGKLWIDTEKNNESYIVNV